MHPKKIHAISGTLGVMTKYVTVEAIRYMTQLVISDLFIPRLLTSNDKVDGCYSNALAMAACSFHTLDN
ncbi:hypothetical protein V1477_021122 [Vespula maculifrons]|uniref:Uncharacterized protein n=1 Tax=Vespula maculifrons TaxID=7453 RepID=A0ABD2AJW5_VESMC